MVLNAISYKADLNFSGNWSLETGLRDNSMLVLLNNFSFFTRTSKAYWGTFNNFAFVNLLHVGFVSGPLGDLWTKINYWIC